MKFKKLSPYAIAPTKGTPDSAGYDLYAAIENHVKIPPHSTVKIPTGIALEIPCGYFGAIYPRSGLSTKQGLRLANCVGVVDADYRGDVTVPLYNDSDKEQIVLTGDRIAQLIVQPYLMFRMTEAEELSDTVRGEGGFGSTGKA